LRGSRSRFSLWRKLSASDRIADRAGRTAHKSVATGRTLPSWNDGAAKSGTERRTNLAARLSQTGAPVGLELVRTMLTARRRTQ
jgi:hypothetical protein